MISTDVYNDTETLEQDVLYKEFAKREIPIPLPDRQGADLSRSRVDRQGLTPNQPSHIPPQIRYISGYVNDYPKIDKLLEEMNAKLETDGVLLGRMRTIHYYKRKQISRGILYRIAYFFSALFHRVFSKLNPISYRIYHSITKGKNQRLSKTEILGRLIKNGFSVQRIIVDATGELFFYAEKRRTPDESRTGSYWPLLKLKRVGKNGKPISVYKIRTMHPYSEYVQEYICQLNGLEKSGKFLNDFRVTSWGKYFRKCWLDEIPMVLNILKGDIKLVGVRPISASYMKLYPEEFQSFRNKFKPGLLPPYYADLPKNFDEILESENRYLQQYQKNPFKTDLKYLLAIIGNIVFRKARSK